MTDLNKMLGGNVDEVKAALAGLSAAELEKLRTAEVAGKNRKGVFEAIEDALSEQKAEGEIVVDAPEAGSFDPSGAPEANGTGPLAHPALDPNPTANASPEATRIDLNDPTADDTALVASRIAEQIGSTAKD
ncbi:hypothetical protein GO308_12830 [Sphingomonas sp. SFZ2018-12]|uniref:hypothetical protein n=1 Tax=Sphingomonas sp. SFZ2018-12 TaxID=2683197 RepID=UPI001F0F7F3C|nr:hypothetical protein [Sphingomonas sp. SFZ2018-12]MCH4894000.1 hypothetical protein [Sphingomonas sp. SFZ2018-12]